MRGAPAGGGAAVGCSQWRAHAAETCFLWPRARAPVWPNPELDVRPVCSAGRLKCRWIILSNRIRFGESWGFFFFFFYFVVYKILGYKEFCLLLMFRIVISGSAGQMHDNERPILIN